MNNPKEDHMKTFLVALFAFAGPAYATGSPPAPESPDIRSDASAASKSSAVGVGIAKGGDAQSASTSWQTQGQTQNQTAQSSSAASTDGNSQNLSIESSYRDRLQAPSAFAPAVYASGPCAYGWSAALSVPGGSVGGGRAKADAACDRREVARVLTPLNPQLALKVLCADPIVAAVAQGNDCTYVEVVGEKVPPLPPAIDLSQYVTRDELVERDRRIMQRTTAK
jgi:hypothetical protein